MAKDSKKDREKALGKAYSKATATLRDRHRDEFNGLYQAEAKEAGIDWSPKLTDEQKAEQELAKIIETYPHLAERLAVAEVAPGEGVASG